MRLQKRGKIVLFSPQKSVSLSWTVVGSIATLRLVCWSLSKFCCYSTLLLKLLNLMAFSPLQPDLSQWSMKQELVCVVNKHGFGILIELCNNFTNQQNQPKIDCPLWVWVKLPAWLQLAKAQPLPWEMWSRRWELGSSSLAVGQGHLLNHHMLQQ